MEIVGRCGALYNLHIGISDLSREPDSQLLFKDRRIVIAQLQIPLNTSLTMLWALAVHSVWEQENKSTVHVPLHFGGGDVVINYDLSSVGEISKLSLPANQTIRISNGIAVVESHDAIFGEERIIGLEVGRNIMQRDVGFSFGILLIVDDCMPM